MSHVALNCTQACVMGDIWVSNVTPSYRNEPDSTRFLIFNSFLLSWTLLFGTSGNLLVCCAVLKNRSLQTPNNTLLVNLAAGGLLKCSVDSPVFLISLIIGGERGGLGLLLCCMQQFTYALCSCGQLLTLVLISLERFQAIAFPFKKRKTGIGVWILFIWVCGLFFASLSVTLCNDPVCYMMCQHLHTLPGSRTDPFAVYVLVPLWVLSLILIIIYYLRIFFIVRQHTNKITDTGVQFKPSLGRSLPAWDRVVSSAPWTAPEHPPKPAGGSRQQLVEFEEDKSARNARAAPHIAGSVCILTPAAREMGKKKLECRVAKRFGYIIITGILFWAPLVVTLLLNLLVDLSQNQLWLLHELETCAIVLSCVPAAMDPLIYALLNRQLRSQLYKLLPVRFRNNK